jgi:hypothetical protein
MLAVVVRVLASLALLPTAAAAAGPTLLVSTYLGGARFEQVRDVVTDPAGNLVVVGGTESADHPTTPGAYGRRHAGWMDVFVTKLAPDGALLWSTLVGGPGYDRAYAVEIGPRGEVLVAGRAAPGFPVTAGALQPRFRGYWSGEAYGDQNGFLLALAPDGARLLWSTWFGVHECIRDIDVDAAGDVLVYTNSRNALRLANPAAWFARAVQREPAGGPGSADAVIAKVRGDGSGVLWATHLGGSGHESEKGSIRVDASGEPVVLTETDSTDAPLAHAHQGAPRGAGDLYLARLAADGSALIFATYFGGSELDWTETHHVAIDPGGDILIDGITHSPDFPTTPGAFQTRFGGIHGRTRLHATGDAFVARFSPRGALRASTFLGGRFGDGAQGIAVEPGGAVVVSGGTTSDDFPVTPDATQPTLMGVEDAFLVRLSGDLSRMLSGTYLGGERGDEGRTVWVGPDGGAVLAGESAGEGWPIAAAFQPRFGGGRADGVVTRFAPARRAPAAAGRPPPASGRAAQGSGS